MAELILKIMLGILSSGFITVGIIWIADQWREFKKALGED